MKENILPLKELCTIEITDGTHQTPTYSDVGYVFLSSKNVTSGVIDWKNVMHIPESLHNELYKRIAPQLNDILLAKNGTTGVAAIVDRDVVFDIYVSLALIRPDPTKVLPKYLLYAINSEQSKNFFDSHLKGIGVPNLHLSHIRETPIKVPAFYVQKNVVDIFDKINTLISLRKQQLTKLDEMVKSRFVEMFGDPLLDDGRYPKVPLGTLAEVGSSKRIFEKEYVSEGVPFYRTKEIVELSKGNRITTELFITRDRYDEIRGEYGVPQKGDLLISAVGTIGVIWIVDGKNDFYFKDGNLLRVAATEKFAPTYIKHLLEALISAYKQEMSSGTAYAALTISALKEMLVYEVPITEQEQFAAFVEQTDKSKLAIQQSLDKLETLKKALMQKYFG